MYYVHTDHLGSLNVITNQNGGIEQELSYDAWGNRRNPDTWVNIPGTPAGLLTRRGFTGHEHMDEFGIINMNGRLYDPVLGRFLSPDPIVANAANTQDYNRYSYCINNPLMFTDPSGYQLIDRMTRDGGSCGTGGVGSWGRSAFDWYDALWQARKDGYTGGSMNFIDAYWDQTSDPNYDGTINFHYWQSSTQLVGKNKGRKLGEVMIVNTKVTMEVKWTVQTNDWYNGKHNSEPAQGSTNVLNDNAWRSQAPDCTGCFRTCCKIVGGTPPKSSAIYVVKESGNSLQVLPDAKLGVATINDYLNNGKPIIVGVNHTLGLSYNEGTTDHYIVIMGSGQNTGQTYYRFFDVGTTRKEAGASPLNRLYLQSDYSLKGITQYNGATYVVTQVRPF